MPCCKVARQVPTGQAIQVSIAGLMSKLDWSRFVAQPIQKDQTKKVKQVDLHVIAEKISGQLNITDLQLQGGEQVTGTVAHTSEWLSPVLRELDERDSTEGVAEPLLVKGDQPRRFPELKNRFYNLVGRGNEIITIPNLDEKRFDRQTFVTPVDLTLIPKDDFDLLRVSTNIGEKRDAFTMPFPNEEEHPLNKTYTREFYIQGGRAGDNIHLHASLNKATKNEIPLDRKARTLTIGSIHIQTGKQRLFGIPMGSGRIRLEWYKFVQMRQQNEFGEIEVIDTLQDVGIGYYGIAELIRWKEGRSLL